MTSNSVCPLTQLEALDLARGSLYYFKKEATLEQKIEAIKKIHWSHGDSCDVGTHNLIPWKAKGLGFYEDNEGELVKLCIECWQADVIMNKEYFTTNPANWVKPIVRIYLLDLEKRWVSVWETSKIEPHLIQIISKDKQQSGDSVE